MQNLAELKLHYLAMEDPEFAVDPFPHFAAARAAHQWLADCAHGKVVHHYEAIKDLLSQDHSMVGAYTDVVDIMGARGTSWGRFQQESLLGSSGEKHARMRRVLAPAFTPQRAKGHRPLMQQVIAEHLDEWAPKGAFDFEEFSSLFPIRVMCKLIGASPDVIPKIRGSLETFGMSMSMDRELLPALVAAMDLLDGFVQDLVAARLKDRKPAGEEDLLEVLVSTLDDGGLSERELYDLLIFLFVAGYDTSKNALTLAMDALISQPALYERCAESLDYCRRVIEENFRFVTTSTVFRTVTKDMVYRDVLIPEGTLLLFALNLAGRDPTAVTDPDSFDPDREQIKKHIAFGQGVHICLGQFIARAQIEEGLHQIAQRMKNPRRTGPSAWRPFFGVWGLRGLPIAFDPAEAMAEV